MSDSLIMMEKGGETICVHPNNVEDHKRLGWKVVEPAVTVTPPSADKSQDRPVLSSKKGKGKS